MPAGKIRIGMLLGKDNDPAVSSKIPKGFPPRLHCSSDMGWGGKVHVDAVTALQMQSEYGDEVEVDYITLTEISETRMKKNHVNFVAGVDVLNGYLFDENKKHHSAFAKKVEKAMLSPECNVFPGPEFQNWIYKKSNYMKQCIKAGIPMLPTIFLARDPNPDRLLKEIKRRGWKKFVVKPETSCWGIGFLAAETAKCEADASILRDHFGNDDPVNGYLVQEFLESTEHKGDSFEEIRTWWINGYFSHAAKTTGQAESFKAGVEIDGITVPPAKEDLVQALAIGQRTMREVLKASTFHGKKSVPALCRFDIGVCARGVQVAGSGWNPNKRTFFLNEIEYHATNWLTRYFANDKKGLGGKAFKNSFEPFDMADRMTEIFYKKAIELCGDAQKISMEPSWMPCTFGGIAAGANAFGPQPKAAAKRGRSAKVLPTSKRTRIAGA